MGLFLIKFPYRRHALQNYAEYTEQNKGQKNDVESTPKCLVSKNNHIPRVSRQAARLLLTLHESAMTEANQGLRQFRRKNTTSGKHEEAGATPSV
jgi:hypothetical protein